MKIIDILNKIANGEEVPKRIKYNNIEYEYEDIGYFSGGRGYLFDTYYTDGILNDEVEILEEDKKIKKLNIFMLKTISDETFRGMIGMEINNLIDEVNKLKEKYKYYEKD